VAWLAERGFFPWERSLVVVQISCFPSSLSSFCAPMQTVLLHEGAERMQSDIVCPRACLASLTLSCSFLALELYSASITCLSALHILVHLIFRTTSLSRLDLYPQRIVRESRDPAKLYKLPKARTLKLNNLELFFLFFPCSAGDRIQGLIQARHVFYPLSYILRPNNLILLVCTQPQPCTNARGYQQFFSPHY
jgi:hypothetical protein